jgi:hypothetical protein
LSSDCGKRRSERAVPKAPKVYVLPSVVHGDIMEGERDLGVGVGVDYLKQFLVGLGVDYFLQICFQTWACTFARSLSIIRIL